MALLFLRNIQEWIFIIDSLLVDLSMVDYDALFDISRRVLAIKRGPGKLDLALQLFHFDIFLDVWVLIRLWENWNLVS